MVCVVCLVLFVHVVLTFLSFFIFLSLNSYCIGAWEKGERGGRRGREVGRREEMTRSESSRRKWGSMRTYTYVCAVKLTRYFVQQYGSLGCTDAQLSLASYPGRLRGRKDATVPFAHARTLT